MHDSNGRNRGGVAQQKGPTWANVREGRITTWKRGADRAVQLAFGDVSERCALYDAARLLEDFA